MMIAFHGTDPASLQRHRNPHATPIRLFLRVERCRRWSQFDDFIITTNIWTTKKERTRHFGRFIQNDRTKKSDSSLRQKRHFSVFNYIFSVIRPALLLSRARSRERETSSVSSLRAAPPAKSQTLCVVTFDLFIAIGYGLKNIVSLIMSETMKFARIYDR
jgi:hypothetical protein